MITNVRIAPTRLGHLNLFVSDLEASTTFYRDVCGFQEVFREQAISMSFMSNGKTHHDLGLMEITPGERLGRDGFRQSASKTPGLNHLGFEMRDEQQLVDAYRRAKQAGIKVSGAEDHQISRSIYVRDLDGHMLEFYSDSIDDWKGFFDANEGLLISGPWDPESGEAQAISRINSNPHMHKSDSAPLQAKTVAYAGVPVKDLMASLHYYEDVLGLDAVLVNKAEKYAVLQGSAHGGCDVCLVEVDRFPASRLLFGGVSLHDGNSIDEAVTTLARMGVDSTIVGADSHAAVIVRDPDRLPLVYSSCSALDLLSTQGAAVIREVKRLHETVA